MRRYRLWIRLNWAVLILFLIVFGIHLSSFLGAQEQVRSGAVNLESIEATQAFLKPHIEGMVLYTIRVFVALLSLLILIWLKRKNPDTKKEEALIDHIGE